MKHFPWGEESHFTTPHLALTLLEKGCQVGLEHATSCLQQTGHCGKVAATCERALYGKTDVACPTVRTYTLGLLGAFAALVITDLQK